MRFLGLDAGSVETRVRSSGCAPRVPSLLQSLMVGALGFGFVGVIAFSAWAFAGRWLYLHGGEMGLYLVCATLFVGLAGWVLHFLVIGPGALGRFYGLFALAFGAYAVAWCLGWFVLRGKTGEWVGSLAGTAVFAGVLVMAFASAKSWRPITLILFLTHSTGYFSGEWIYEFLSQKPGTELFGYFLDKSKVVKIGMLSWGLAYGIGFGIGLGYALHRAQEPIRVRLTTHAAN